MSVIQRILSEVAYLAWSVHPRQVGEVRVHRHAHNFTVYIMELICFVTECDDLSRAYKSAAKLNKKICFHRLTVIHITIA